MTNYNYGGGNPMRPHRVRLTTNLVDGYGLTSKMQLMRPVAKPREDIMLFHADGEYQTREKWCCDETCLQGLILLGVMLPGLEDTCWALLV